MPHQSAHCGLSPFRITGLRATRCRQTTKQGGAHILLHPVARSKSFDRIEPVGTFEYGLCLRLGRAQWLDVRKRQGFGGAWRRNSEPIKVHVRRSFPTTTPQAPLTSSPFFTGLPLTHRDLVERSLAVNDGKQLVHTNPALSLRQTSLPRSVLQLSFPRPT